MRFFTPKRFIELHRIKRLYKRAFPITEKKPFSVILRMHKLGKTDIWYFEHKGKFIGLATTINGPREVLIDYFAVEKKYRGRGYGTAMLKTLINLYSPLGVFLEIEIPYPNGERYREKAARKNFYLNAGLSDMHTQVKLFGVDMELLGTRCSFDFEKYRKFYLENYGKLAYKNIKTIK